MELDSKGRFRIKYCPCNKSNKDGKFVPYIGCEKYGYCHSCDKTFFSDGNTYIPDLKKKVNKPKQYFQKDYLLDLLFDYEGEQNNFVYFLQSTIGFERTNRILKKYFLGTGSNNSVLFPHIDNTGNIVALKYMMYDKATGKRHNTIWFDDAVAPRHKPCLFGLHLVNKSDKPIGIVESEKSSCLMSDFHPNYTWTSCGGSKGLTDEKIETLNHKTVHLFPDHGKYDLWTERKLELEKKYPFIDFEISRECEIWHNEGKINNGDDIADYYLLYNNKM